MPTIYGSADSWLCSNLHSTTANVLERWLVMLSWHAGFARDQQVAPIEAKTFVDCENKWLCLLLYYTALLLYYTASISEASCSSDILVAS